MQKLITAFALLASMPVLADIPAQQRQEVNHLLSFVQTSKCIINRNGSDHQGPDAAKHMKKKYDYFRDDIDNTEDFIRLSATKSTMSGKYYTVRCGDESEIKTQDWLLSELKSYRKLQEELMDCPSEDI